MKLNLGCGFNYRKDFVNCDLRQNLKADKHFDLNTFPYPFKENSIDFILISHVLEHLEDPIKVLKECHRILKLNGELQVEVPYFASECAFADIDHKHFFGITTFNTITQKEKNHFRGPFNSLMNFEIINRRLIWRKFFKPLENLINISYKTMRIYQELFCWILPARAIKFNFIKKKLNQK
ncbi:methyltransferase domain-containing protein [archaeon]|jgi:SAM-dependent methyltransferase|nr:methyltransferase domain-containing protein [archaeon]MBT6182465.1 methyltransferase domain-containing protein [archaeon]MBT6606298.1 methyltransferase domain-containing protein [archaeon]MBT7251533.1 methyltransferase domain-containing protein [archaeon]MBT7661174.1 methyltransferase domain-containing protein [archaeon]